MIFLWKSNARKISRTRKKYFLEREILNLLQFCTTSLNIPIIYPALFTYHSIINQSLHQSIFIRSWVADLTITFVHRSNFISQHETSRQTSSYY